MGIVTLVRPLQPENAQSPMEETELGMVTLVNPLHLNAPKSMVVTELPILTLVNPEQL